MNIFYQGKSQKQAALALFAVLSFFNETLLLNFKMLLSFKPRK